MAQLLALGYPSFPVQQAAARYTDVEAMVALMEGWGVRPSPARRATALVAGLRVEELRAILRGAAFDCAALPSLTERELRQRAAEALLSAAGEGGMPSLPAPAPSAEATASTSLQAKLQPRGGASLHHVTATSDEDAADRLSVVELLPQYEHHVLRFETQVLRDLGDTLVNLAAKEGLGMIVHAALKETLFHGIMAAVRLPQTVLRAYSILDNPWAVAYERAKKAGKLLASVLYDRNHGARPAVLVGFGLGAFSIFECLSELEERFARGDGRAAGIVQHVVMMGLPVPCDAKLWSTIGHVVSGRIINCYRPDDLVLSVVYRACNLETSCAGISAVNCTGVENFDISSLVSAHHMYRHRVTAVLQHVRLEEDRAPMEPAHRGA